MPDPSVYFLARDFKPLSRYQRWLESEFQGKKIMLKTEFAVKSKWKVKKGKQWVAEEMEEISRQGMKEVWYNWFVNRQSIFSKEFRPFLIHLLPPTSLPRKDQKYCSLSLDDPLVAFCYCCGIQLWDNHSKGKKKYIEVTPSHKAQDQFQTFPGIGLLKSVWHKLTSRTSNQKVFSDHLIGDLWFKSPEILACIFRFRVELWVGRFFLVWWKLGGNWSSSRKTHLCEIFNSTFRVSDSDKPLAISACFTNFWIFEGKFLFARSWRYKKTGS